jgi:hypothetical protein
MNSVIKTIRCSLSVLLLSFVPHNASAQVASPPRVSTAYAVLTSKVESKTANLDQGLTLRITRDVLVEGKVVIPAGSRVEGRIVELSIKDKDHPQSTLAVVIDKAIIESGREIPLQAIVAAVAVPQKGSLSSDPTYGMMHSNEPKMVGTAPGTITAASKVDSTATVATARLKGGMDNRELLENDSQGAIGFSDLSLSWRLAVPPAVTVFSSSSKNIKLEAGTQILLRMASPQIPR